MIALQTDKKLMAIHNMNEFDSIAYLDAVDVFTSEVEYRWDDDIPVPTDDYIIENDFEDNF